MPRLLLALAYLLSVISISQETDYLVVETVYGLVRGSRDGGSKSFKGIPYARPPVGKLRWQRPQPPDPWTSIYDATKDPPGCPQVHCSPPIACPHKFSEDCLYLNIFAPLHADDTSGLPVMVFIHGGNFYYMSGSSPVFDGQFLVEKGNVVVVTLNYRLGALGFLVTGRSGNDAQGNYGLLDQMLALKWVKNNIRGFGGDPDKVTLFGESAGAYSIIQHMTSAESSAYFRGAILESCPANIPFRNYREALVLSAVLATQLNCSVGDMACLRSRSAEEVTEASYKTTSEFTSLRVLELFLPYGPYVDGNLVKGQPLDVFNAGHFHKKPLLLGTTTEEAVLFAYSIFQKPMSAQSYIALLAATRRDKFKELLNQYPPNFNSSDQRELLSVTATDALFTCPNRNLSRLVLETGSESAWVYLWDHAMSFDPDEWATHCTGRVCHGAELVFVFGTASKGNFTFTPEEVRLSDDVIAYWTNFAWTGDPNSSGDKFADNSPRFLDRRSGSLRPSGISRMRRYKNRPDIDAISKNKLHSEESLYYHDWSPKGKTTPLMFWPPYENSTDWSAMLFQTPKRNIVQDYRREHCDFFDDIGYVW